MAELDLCCTDGEVDKGKLGMSCRERILLELTPEDKVALKSR